MPDDDLKPLRQLLGSYSAAWAANDATAIAGHWNTDAFRFYKAEEITAYLTRWEDVQAYWRHNEGFHDKVGLRFDPQALLALNTGWAIGITRMRWDIRFARGTTTMDGAAFGYAGTTMGGDNHVLLLLAQTNQGLRLAGWSETPDAPISYIAQLYQKDVTPGF